MPDNKKDLILGIIRYSFVIVLTIMSLSVICSVIFASEYDDPEPVAAQGYDDGYDDGYYDDEEEYYEVYEDDFSYALNPDRDYLIIVNDENEYEFGGDYDTELQKDIVYLPDCYGEDTPIEYAAAEAFGMLKKYLSEEKGIKIELYELYSAYRTWDDQQWVCDYYSQYEEDWAKNNYIAEPGFSEHHTGLLLDIVVWWPKIDAWATETPERTAEDPKFFRKIHKALADYGFIDRYPKGAEDVTGYPNEPYEIRFVGSSEVAHEIMDNDLSLEEYVDSYSYE